jgi:hypothetical protein
MKRFARWLYIRTHRLELVTVGQQINRDSQCRMLADVAVGAREVLDRLALPHLVNL